MRTLKRIALTVLAASFILLVHTLDGAAQAMPQSYPSTSDGTSSLPVDLSVGAVEETMKNFPDARALGKWGYTQGLFLYAELLVYRRTHDPRYLAYIQVWADANVDANGKIDSKLEYLDDLLPGNLMVGLYQETGKEKYKVAAQTIRARFNTYPRSTDGGLWHAASDDYAHQLWLDGMYMSMPFLVHYGEAFGDRKYAYDEAATQLQIYAKHLSDPATGLLFHAYDESGKQPWANPVTHHSSFFWARSIGWYGMTLVDVLETMPANHPARPRLIALVNQLAHAFAKFQDPGTGLWYNVVDKADDPANWQETSASTMYVYMLSRAVQRGYIPRSYQAVACKGFRGVLTQLSADPQGRVSVANICAGTIVSDLSYYLGRPHTTNDIHGTGAFILMNEQMRRAPCVAKVASR